MFGLGKLFNKATGMEKEYGPVSIHGYPLYCQVCKCGEFWRHQVQMHTPMATFFNLDFANRIADCAVCANCGYVHWFLPTNMAPQPSEEPDSALAQK